MILVLGDKVLIVHRRLYESDNPRYFVGEVKEFEAGIAKVTGQTWLEDPFTRRVIRKEGVRTKLLPVLSGSLIVYQLAAATDLSSVKFEFSDDGRLWLVGDPDLKLDMSEAEYLRGKRKVA